MCIRDSQGPLQEGLRRGDHGLHRGGRPLRAPGSPGADPGYGQGAGGGVGPQGSGVSEAMSESVSEAMSAPHLRRLENTSVHILREAYANFGRLCMLWSVGKDSTVLLWLCLLYTSPSPRDRTRSRMPSS